jgi:hypothetical protein
VEARVAVGSASGVSDGDGVKTSFAVAEGKTVGNTIEVTEGEISTGVETALELHPLLNKTARTTNDKNMARKRFIAFLTFHPHPGDILLYK